MHQCPQALLVVQVPAPHAADRVADAGRLGVDQHLGAQEERLAALGRPAEADRLMDVAEAGDRAAHVADPRRGHGDLVGQPQRLAPSPGSDRSSCWPIGRPRSTSMQLSSASAAWMSAGLCRPWAPGCRPASVAHHGAQVLQGLAGRRRLHPDEDQGRSALAGIDPRKDLTICRARSCSRGRERRPRLFEVDDDRVGARRVGVVDFASLSGAEQHRAQGFRVLLGH